MFSGAEVYRGLTHFEKEVLPKMIAEKLEKAAQIIENAAKENCPVDTGQLRASISHSVEGNKAIVGTDVEYAAIVHEKNKAYLQKAVDENMQSVLDAFKGGF